MADGRIRVGIVGANPDWGWAARAHIPALRALPDYEITAVGTTRTASARAAADRFGVRCRDRGLDDVGQILVVEDVGELVVHVGVI